LVAISMLILVFIEPNLRKLFNFEITKINHFFIPIIGSVSVLVVFEVLKSIRMKKT